MPVNYDQIAALASDGSINRYYDPVTGQFMSVDPLAIQTDQPYGYANEDPADGSDPTGLKGGPGGACAFGYSSVCPSAPRMTPLNGIETVILAVIGGGVACLIAEPCGAAAAGAVTTCASAASNELESNPAADDAAANTGRAEAQNVAEQLAMEEAKAHPELGTRVPIIMNDANWPASDGWVKMQQINGSVNIHYVYNTITGAAADFKYK